MHKVFETPEIVHLYVEIGRGHVQLGAGDTTRTVVEVTGERADEVIVDQEGHNISVVAPQQRSGFRREPALNVTVTVPSNSEAAVRTGSADIHATGTWGTAQLKTGSGEVEIDHAEAALVIETGSGDVAVRKVGGEAKIKCGSGDVRITETLAGASIRVGSGDIHIDRAAGATAVKTGSGDLTVSTADGDIAMATGSGDVTVHRFNRGTFSLKGASGEVAVGIPAGVPVWTDISTVSGTLQSNLAGAGSPADGDDFIELRLKTVSGNITLKQL